MSNLLIDEPPLQVLPSLAKKIGLAEAIIVQQIHYWLQKSENWRDGERWVYNTHESWQLQFPWWSCESVKRYFIKLERDGILISTPKYNTIKINRTKWYRIDYHKLAHHPKKDDVQKCHVQGKEMPPSDGGKNAPPIPKEKNTTEKKADRHFLKTLKQKYHNLDFESILLRARAELGPRLDRNTLAAFFEAEHQKFAEYQAWRKETCGASA